MEGKGSYPGPLPTVATAMAQEGDRAASTLARGKKTSRCLTASHYSAHGRQRTRSGHRREGARRRRAHPKGSLRIGEGAHDSIVLSSWSPWVVAAVLYSTLTEKGEENRMKLGFGCEMAVGF
jgi:hypothetical protein